MPSARRLPRGQNRVASILIGSDAVREGIRNVVVYVYDRIARNFTDGEMLEKLVRAESLVLHIAASGSVLHKKSDDAAFMMFDFNILTAKAENRARARRAVDGMTALCEAGRFPSRPATFYWQVSALDDKGRLKRGQGHVAGPTPEGRALLQRQVALRIGGASLEIIRETCLDEGLVPSSLVPRSSKPAVRDRQGRRPRRDRRGYRGHLDGGRCRSRSGALAYRPKPVTASAVKAARRGGHVSAPATLTPATSPVESLGIMLRALKLPAFARYAEEIAQKAEREGWTFGRSSSRPCLFVPETCTPRASANVRAGRASTQARGRRETQRRRRPHLRGA